MTIVTTAASTREGKKKLTLEANVIMFIMSFFLHYVLVALLSITLVLVVQKYITSTKALAALTLVSLFCFWFLTSASIVQYTLSTFPQFMNYSMRVLIFSAFMFPFASASRVFLNNFKKFKFS